jgi:hypothetical protein
MIEPPFDLERLPDPNFKVPDLIQAVEGWRVWRVSTELPRFGASPKMYSATHSNYYWTPRKVSLAACRKCDQDVPGEKCSCGFYSAKTFSHLMTMAYHWYNMDDGYVMVLGQVANWGKVIEGTQGWRAAMAYPVKLWVPFESWKIAQALEDGYGVPVALKNYLKPAGRRAM